MNEYTVPTFFIAFIVGLAMQLDSRIIKVTAWHVGIARIDAWRSKASLLGAGAAAVAWFKRLFTWRSSLRVLAALALLAVFAHDASVAHVKGHVMLLATTATVAEPTLADVKTAIEASNRAFTEFKETNSARIKAIEEGRAVDPLITAKLDKLNAAMDTQAKVNEDFMALQASVNKLRLMGQSVGGDLSPVEELKAFNLSARAHAQAVGAPTPAEVTMDGYKAYAEAFDKYCRRGDRGLTDADRKSLSVGNDLNGGFLVSPDKSGRIVTRIYETSPMRQFASVQPISTDALEGMADIDDASAGWVSELGSRTDTATPNVPAPWRIPVQEGYSQPKASQKLIEDANIDIAQWLSKKVGDKCGRLQNTGFVTGSGTGKPRGFASYTTASTADATRAWGTPQHTASGTSGGFGSDPTGIQKIVTLMHTLKDVYSGKAAFYSNRFTRGAVRLLTDNSVNGKFVFLPSLVAAMPDTLLGYPYRIMQDMADYTTANALALAYGDMEETYQIVDRLGLSLLVDPFTAKPYIVYYTRFRVGGDVVNFESMKFLKFGTS